MKKSSLTERPQAHLDLRRGRSRKRHDDGIGLDALIQARAPRRISNAVTVAVLSFCVTGCASLQHRQLLNETEVALGAPVVNLPVHVSKGLFVIEGQLSADGRSVLWLVDTGAFESKLTASTAKTAGVEPVLHRDNSDSFGRSRRMPVGQLPLIRFGEFEVRKLSVGLLDWPDSAITPCLARDGLLGANALRGLSWSADFQAPGLKLSRDAQQLAAPPGAARIAVSFPSLSATPIISATVNGRVVQGLLVDLGSNGGLVLPRKLLESMRIPRERQTMIDDASSAGIYGAARQHGVRAPVRLRLGDLESIEVMAEFTDDSSPKLGTAVLSHYRLWLDHDNRTLSLAPATQPEAFAQRELPHGVLPGVDWTLDRWHIGAIEYPALTSRNPPVEVGDRFDTINGQRPSEVFSGWCDYVEGVRNWLENQASLELVDLARGERTRIEKIVFSP